MVCGCFPYPGVHNFTTIEGSQSIGPWALGKGNEEDSTLEFEKDTTGAKYLKLENSNSFYDICSYMVELPVSEHGRPEVKDAKKNEIEDLTKYDVFEEVDDVLKER